MAVCVLCNTSSRNISKELGVCLKCIRERPGDALPIVMEAHTRSRAAFGLPEKRPKEPQGIPCNICVNECRIPENGTGYCGLRRNERGRLTGVSPDQGKLSWYHDPLPTNCVGDWVCPGGTGAGYPEYAYCPGPEHGYKNLAVFFHACSFNCLFCQTGISGKRSSDHIQPRPVISHRLWTKRLPASAISAVIPLPRPLFPSGHRDLRLMRTKAGFSEYAGRQTDPCIPGSSMR